LIAKNKISNKPAKIAYGLWLMVNVRITGSKYMDVFEYKVEKIDGVLHYAPSNLLDYKRAVLNLENKAGN